ncbi:type II toxin-antitoxin system Phd/YefM family antitoxin [Nocardia sp. NPDC049149]|uniref:type II toxin-antitoxin system Phd/YefM family antitoxin n=1 Tax=Nocardia sp. NPDC049149 TaxID=3364315 RepID=UPI0037104890
MSYDNQEDRMQALPISNVRQDLFGLVKKVNDNHDPVTVVTKTGDNAVLVAESDWSAIMETLYVLQTHGGAQLLASVQDARVGRTEARALLDPDADGADEETASRRRHDVTWLDYDLPSGRKTKHYVVAPAEMLAAIAEKVYGDDATDTRPDNRFQRFAAELQAKGIDASDVEKFVALWKSIARDDTAATWFDTRRTTA